MSLFIVYVRQYWRNKARRRCRQPRTLQINLICSKGIREADREPGVARDAGDQPDCQLPIRLSSLRAAIVAIMIGPACPPRWMLPLSFLRTVNPV